MYKRAIGGWAKHWDFMLLDILALQISLILAYYIRYRHFYNYEARNPYRTSAIVLFFLSIIAAIIFDTMHNVLRRGIWEELKRSILQTAAVFGGIVTALFTTKDSSHVSRIVLYICMMLYFIFSLIIRLIYKKILLNRRKEIPLREMVLVGDEKGIAKALEAFKLHPEAGINVKGIVEVPAAHGAEASGTKGSRSAENTGIRRERIEIGKAADYIRNEWIDEVYIALTDASPVQKDVDELIRKCMEMAVTVHYQVIMSLSPAVSSDNDDPHMSGIIEYRQWIERIAKQPVLTTSINIPRPKQLLIKRMMDIFFGFILSIVAVIVLLITAPLIKLFSPGPVLLRLERIGQNGRRFKMYMIRTMYMDAASRKDKVIKGIGTLLRRTYLDQVPKGFNVLLGTMSLVGTRPPSPAEWENYEYHHRARLSCKPGLTGLWEVSGRKQLTFEEATAFDTGYIANWSLRMDLMILCRTVFPAAPGISKDIIGDRP